MGRRIFLAAAVAWTLLGAIGLVIAIAWRDRLIAVLPPLAIDADALGGAITVIAVAAFGVGVAHVVIAVGLGRRNRWALSAGALLASVLAAAFVALTAAATASAVREAALGPQLAAAAALSALAAVVYGLTAARFVAELKSGSAI